MKVGIERKPAQRVPVNVKKSTKKFFAKISNLPCSGFHYFYQKKPRNELPDLIWHATIFLMTKYFIEHYSRHCSNDNSFSWSIRFSVILTNTLFGTCLSLFELLVEFGLPFCSGTRMTHYLSELMIGRTSFDVSNNNLIEIWKEYQPW